MESSKRQNSQEALRTLLKQTKVVAQAYQDLTGRPMGITGEVAEYEAARLLGLKLCPARQPGYDALESLPSRVKRVQIKGRRFGANAKPGQRIGSIDVDNKNWDTVLLVLLDEGSEATGIWEAKRKAVINALQSGKSIARNQRHSLSVPQFIRIAQQRWPVAPPRPQKDR